MASAIITATVAVVLHGGYACGGVSGSVETEWTNYTEAGTFTTSTTYMHTCNSKICHTTHNHSTVRAMHFVHMYIECTCES